MNEETQGGEQMRFLPIYFLVIITGIFIFPFWAEGQDEHITITTYYPSPAGSYRNLQLFPQDPTSAQSNIPPCDDEEHTEGLMYFDTSLQQLMVCSQYFGSWQYLVAGGGYWKQGEVRKAIIPSRAFWRVGIGFEDTTAEDYPQANLHIREDPTHPDHRNFPRIVMEDQSGDVYLLEIDTEPDPSSVPPPSSTHRTLQMYFPCRQSEPSWGMFMKADESQNVRFLGDVYVRQSPQRADEEGNPLPANLGVGTMFPQARVDVHGGVKIGDDTDTCNSDKAGTLRYRAPEGSSTGLFQYCNGSNWVAMGSGLSGCVVETNSVDANTCSVQCPSEKRLVSGGCKYTNEWGIGQHEQIHASYPDLSINGWQCEACRAGQSGDGRTCTAYVYCCD